ncbi:thioesterase family protein [Terasakiella pusilla]|uniref:thioesterase family protein n=1 Tax=Terasakiella pusilla TaxID=64973 RepID=UPI003AA818AC
MQVNDVYEFAYKVQEADLAKELAIEEGDAFPPVFATARMVGLMELAAARLMRPLLSDGELSVGVNVNVNHTAATSIDAEIKLKASFLGMEGKLYKFQVELFDQGGLAGKGIHTRAIIVNERLLEGAKKRCGDIIPTE